MSMYYKHIPTMYSCISTIMMDKLLLVNDVNCEHKIITVWQSVMTL